MRLSHLTWHRQGKKDLVARFGGIPLRQDRRAVIRDPAPAQASHPRKELIYRLRKRACELCEQGATVAVHQVAALKHLGTPGPGQPAWAALMARMRRKTLIVCAPCHEHIHALRRARGINRWRARRIETMHTGFGGRPTEKAHTTPKEMRDLAVRPTLRTPTRFGNLIILRAESAIWRPVLWVRMTPCGT